MSDARPNESRERLLIEAARRQVRSGTEVDWSSITVCQSKVDTDHDLAAPSQPSSRSGSTHVLPPGTILDRYEILSPIHSGGMGEIYKARHQRLDKLVAIKVIRSDRDNSDTKARFEREMKVTGYLSHPNVIVTSDAGEVDGKQFFVMEYVDGIDTARLVRRETFLPIAESCEIIRQAALGLEHVHAHGLTHRDVKPSNLMVTAQGQVKVIDLGLVSRQVELDEETLTQEGQPLGTAEFMAPEQWEDSKGSDSRTDIYGLGCTLYFLLTGQPPFSRREFPSFPRLMRAHLEREPEPILNRRPDAPPELDGIIRRMLAKNPADRFGSLGELMSLLEPLVRNHRLGALVSPTHTVPAEEPIALLDTPIKSDRDDQTTKEWVPDSGDAVVLEQIAQPKRVRWLRSAALGVLAGTMIDLLAIAYIRNNDIPSMPTSWAYILLPSVCILVTIEMVVFVLWWLAQFTRFRSQLIVFSLSMFIPVLLSNSLAPFFDSKRPDQPSGNPKPARLTYLGLGLVDPDGQLNHNSNDTSVDRQVSLIIDEFNGGGDPIDVARRLLALRGPFPLMAQVQNQLVADLFNLGEFALAADVQKIPASDGDRVDSLLRAGLLECLSREYVKLSETMAELFSRFAALEFDILRDKVSLLQLVSNADPKYRYADLVSSYSEEVLATSGSPVVRARALALRGFAEYRLNRNRDAYRSFRQLLLLESATNDSFGNDPWAQHLLKGAINVYFAQICSSLGKATEAKQAIEAARVEANALEGIDNRDLPYDFPVWFAEASELILLREIDNYVAVEHARGDSIGNDQESQPSPTPKENVPVKGAIAGVVVVGDSKISGAIVSIEGVGETKTDANGAFRIVGIPPGKYLAKASTGDRSRGRSGQVMVTVLPGKEASAEIHLSISDSSGN